MSKGPGVNHKVERALTAIDTAIVKLGSRAVLLEVLRILRKQVVTRNKKHAAMTMRGLTMWLRDWQEDLEDKLLVYRYVLENITTLSEVLVAVSVWTGQPVWEHDCSACTYLGTVAVPDTEYTFPLPYDLYYCTQGGTIPTVIARFGALGNYTSGILFARSYLREGRAWHPLAQALMRATDAGYTTKEGI